MSPFTPSPFTPSDFDWSVEGTIRVRSGRYVELLDPKPDEIALEDIAHALAYICRFGGHTASFYSVAEHSLFVSAMLHRQFGDPRLTLAGLLHDATEAYLGDMVRPLKRQLPAYKEAEDRMADVIAQHFGIDGALFHHPLVREADEQALVFEMAAVRDAQWRQPSNPFVVASAFIARATQLGIS